MYDHLKTPLNRNLNDWATKRIQDAIQTNGGAIPCSVVTPMGPTVLVNFDVNGAPFVLPNVEVSVSMFQYARPPIQAGDMGEVIWSAVPNGAVTGLGSGTPGLLARGGNLSSLIFVPVGNKGWSASDDPNAYVIYGPTGVILRTSSSSQKLTLNASGVSTSGPLAAGNGWTGTFQTGDSRTCHVVAGIITNVA